MTLNDFIQKANSVYRENPYNYSKVSEIKANKKICIICSKGYEFWQRPYDHLAGYGCKCRYSFCPKNLESFISGAKQIYGDVYNYSLLSENFSDYKVDDKIPIICKKHGLFYSKKIDFLAGHGCKKCANEKLSKDRKISDTDFILKAQKIHNDKYDYSELKFRINSNTKHREAYIICSKHGPFWQDISNHLSGSGCNKCKYEKSRDTSNRKSKILFLEKAELLYKGSFDYSNINYVDFTKTPISLKCKKHGSFLITPQLHLKRKFGGCPVCNREHSSELRSLSFSSFLKRANTLYDDKFSYNQNSYKKGNAKVEMTCKVCGHTFLREARSHISEYHECPYCYITSTRSRGEVLIKEFLKKYNINFEAQKRFKTCRDKLPLPFDFYLPDYNMCIEYQGEQHYKNAFFLKQDSCSLEKTQLHDQIKRDWCKNNNIKEIEIPYWERDSISLILKNSLNLN